MDPEDPGDPERAREERLRRARESIGRSFDDLIARSSGGPSPPAEPPSPAPPSPAGAEAERDADLRASARIDALEHRLELRARSIETELREEAAGARRAAEGAEHERLELARRLSEIEDLRARMEARFADARDTLEGVAREGAVAEAARAVDGLEERVGARFDDLVTYLGGHLHERIGEEVREAAERVERSLEGRIDDAVRGHLAAVDRMFRERVESEAESIRVATRSEAEAAVAQAGRQAWDGASLAVAAAVDASREDMEARLEQQFRSNVGRGVDEAAAELRAELARERESFREEAEGLRGELGRRRIKRQREGAEEALRAREREALESIGAVGRRLEDDLARAAEEAAARAADGLEERAAAAERELWASESELRADVEYAAAAGLEERLDEAFEGRAAELERRISMLASEAEGRAERRLVNIAAVAEQRLEAADHAQEREERVRERIQRAEREARTRVREAERRLIEVMSKLNGGSRPVG